MRVFADHCIPADVIRALRETGIDVERALDAGLDRASDEKLFEHARKTAQVLLTLDHDFGNIARFRIDRSAGVVLLAVEGMSKATIVNRVRDFLTGTRTTRLRGRMFLIDHAGVHLWPKR